MVSSTASTVRLASRHAPTRRNMRRAIFIDKDGTLIQDIPYNVDPALLHFNAGAVEALKIFSRMGFALIIISNQSGIARGFFNENDLHRLRIHLTRELNARGVTLDAFMFCPHHPEGIVAPYAIACKCRKPMPGMILQAAARYDIDLTRSWMIGDILNDVEAGNRAGCKTILLNNGHETEWIASKYRNPAAIVSSFEEAVKVITHQHQLV